MSLLSKVFKKAKGLIRKVAPVASLIPGPVGIAAGTIGGLLGPGSKASRGAAAAPATFGLPAASIAPMGVSGMSILPNLGRLALGGTAVATAGRVVVAGGRRVFNSAQAYCRKHPAWCAGIGGTAAVEAMINAGQLPALKKRRAKGISGTELKNFRRVARVIHKYCAPVRSAMRSPAMRRGRR